MRILIDIGHPAHVHYFKHFAKDIIARGNEVLFTCRDKDVTISLLEYYGYKYLSFGRSFKSIPGKFLGLFYFTIRLFVIALKFKPDIYINSTMYSAIVSKLLGKPHIAIEDTFNKEQVRLYLPFTNCILTGDYTHPGLGKKEICYRGYQELFYLHPKRFIPDTSIFKELGISQGTPYVILRFVSWNASHDIGHKGISTKIALATNLSRHAQVYITSESPLPDELEKYRIKIEPARIHDAIAFASLLFGESATMATEAAMLGVPGIYIDNTGRYYTRDIEDRYGLVFNYSESEEDQLRSIDKALDILTKTNKRIWKERYDLMISQKIDVTSLMVWLVENFPQGMSVLKKSSDFQNKFR